MDAGAVAEVSSRQGPNDQKQADVQYDTPVTLFDRPDSIFRSLCNVKKISREDLLQIQAEAVQR